MLMKAPQRQCIVKVRCMKVLLLIHNSLIASLFKYSYMYNVTLDTFGNKGVYCHKKNYMREVADKLHNQLCCRHHYIEIDQSPENTTSNLDEVKQRYFD